MYRHTHGIVLLELDVVIIVPVEFACEIAQDGLEKGVDGAHVEVAVVKHQLKQGLTRQRPHLVARQARLIDKALQVLALHVGL